MSTKPNLVLIMSDDQGYGDLAGYGAPYLDTPNIDGIGRRGMRFTQHYAGSPLCTPSRAALLTGAWPPRVNMPNVLNPLQPQGMPQQETLLPEYLKTAGYATGHFGKWHLGDPAANPAHHPDEPRVRPVVGHPVLQRLPDGPCLRRPRPSSKPSSTPAR